MADDYNETEMASRDTYFDNISELTFPSPSLSSHESESLMLSPS